MGQVYQGFDGVEEEILSGTNLGELGIAPVCVAPGVTCVEHSHDLVEEVIVVKAGRGQVEIEDQCHEVRAGSVAVVGAGEFHAIHNTGDENLEMVIVFNSNVDLASLTLKTREEHFGTQGVIGRAERAALTELKSAAASMNGLLEEVRDELAALRAPTPAKRTRARSGQAA